MKKSFCWRNPEGLVQHLVSTCRKPLFIQIMQRRLGMMMARAVLDRLPIIHPSGIAGLRRQSDSFSEELILLAKHELSDELIEEDKEVETSFG